MCLTNVSIEAQLFLHKFVVRQGERERERQRERDRERQREREREVGGTGGPGRGVRRQKIIDGRTAGHYRLQDCIDVTPSCIDSIDGLRAASNN
jgi:hypothetical protein